MWQLYDMSNSTKQAELQSCLLGQWNFEEVCDQYTILITYWIHQISLVVILITLCVKGVIDKDHNVGSVWMAMVLHYLLMVYFVLIALDGNITGYCTYCFS